MENYPNQNYESGFMHEELAEAIQRATVLDAQLAQFPKDEEYDMYELPIDVEAQLEDINDHIRHLYGSEIYIRTLEVIEGKEVDDYYFESPFVHTYGEKAVTGIYKGITYAFDIPMDVAGKSEEKRLVLAHMIEISEEELESDNPLVEIVEKTHQLIPIRSSSAELINDYLPNFNLLRDDDSVLNVVDQAKQISHLGQRLNYLYEQTEVHMMMAEAPLRNVYAGVFQHEKLLPGGLKLNMPEKLYYSVTSSGATHELALSGADTLDTSNMYFGLAHLPLFEEEELKTTTAPKLVLKHPYNEDMILIPLDQELGFKYEAPAENILEIHIEPTEEE